MSCSLNLDGVQFSLMMWSSMYIHLIKLGIVTKHLFVISLGSFHEDCQNKLN